jgi:hypothetical protein
VQLVYWICLIIGGIFVAIATAGGLGDLDFDADGDVDLSADADRTNSPALENRPECLEQF